MKQMGFVSWLCALTATLLLLALLDMPYVYYQALRWWVLFACGFAAMDGLEDRSGRWAVIPIAMAVLFNPFVPFAFSRDAWAVLDVLAAVAFGLLAWLARNDRPVAATPPQLPKPRSGRAAAPAGRG